MDATTAALVAGCLGVVVGAVAVLASRMSERHHAALPPSPDDEELPSGVSEVLSVLRSAAVVLDVADGVVRASPAAYAFGLVRGHDVVHPELRRMAREVRRSGVIEEAELDLPRGPVGRGRLVVQARVAPLGADHVLLLVEDRTEARRVEEIRRDFVANVSHELKTPVGAIALLAEAVDEAADDPDAVRHFASRMQRESQRLAALVQEIIDLSRLQVADALHDPQLVEVDEVIAEALDRSRLAADTKRIDIVVGGAAGAVVYGDAELLVTAVRNLVDNACAYSPEGTRVAVSVRRHSGLVEITVSDQGLGIPAADLDRIFERFYRVDPARSRQTGGTGLGLAIVKHVAANHGGEVTVWSAQGQGSTFTMRMPDSRSGRPVLPNLVSPDGIRTAADAGSRGAVPVAIPVAAPVAAPVETAEPAEHDPRHSRTTTTGASP